MNNNFYINAFYTTTYNDIYKRYQPLCDEVLIENWSYHQHQAQRRDDYDWIAFLVCEDLLRQRGNSYLDENYPKD